MQSLTGSNYFIPIVIAAVMFSPLLMLYVKRWDLALLGCLLYIPISGYVAVRLDRNPIAVQAKDFFFLIPAYIGFATHLRSGIRFSGIPRPFTLATLLLTMLVFLHLLNPAPQAPPLLGGILGVKVWLFYIPLVMLGYMYISAPQNFQILTRLILVSSWIPAATGILQYYLSKVYGFPKVMKWFYADEARAVSFSFSVFETSTGTIFRIPSTFSFISQYSNFLFFVLCVAFISISLEQTRFWRTFAYCSLALILTACVFSGARGLLFFAPLALLGFMFVSRGAAAAVGAFIVFGGFSALVGVVTGFNPLGVAGNFLFLVSEYLFNFAPKQLIGSVINYPLGAGTGVATPQVRHLAGVTAIHTIPNEGYFSRAVLELGIPGLIVAIALITIPAIVGLHCITRTKNRHLRAILASLFVYQVFIIVSSLKGAPLDQDPANVYFWLSVGMTFRIRAYFNSELKTARFAQQAPKSLSLPIPVTSRAREQAAQHTTANTRLDESLGAR